MLLVTNGVKQCFNFALFREGLQRSAFHLSDPFINASYWLVCCMCIFML